MLALRPLSVHVRAQCIRSIFQTRKPTSRCTSKRANIPLDMAWVTSGFKPQHPQMVFQGPIIAGWIVNPLGLLFWLYGSSRELGLERQPSARCLLVNLPSGSSQLHPSAIWRLMAQSLIDSPVKTINTSTPFKLGLRLILQSWSQLPKIHGSSPLRPNHSMHQTLALRAIAGDFES